uniref:Calcium uniporter regulatory subunit MCUb n=1 Tax=Oncorhynchus tshawytscha TaxID=74940 RepID=A0AAZ3PYV6_ONCTS
MNCNSSLSPPPSVSSFSTPPLFSLLPLRLLFPPLFSLSVPLRLSFSTPTSSLSSPSPSSFSTLLSLHPLFSPLFPPPLLSPPPPELCQFSLRPMLMTVTDFLSDIQREDPGVAIAAVLNTDGERVCSSTSIDTVLNQDFQILINSTIYRIHSRAEVPNSSPEHSTSIDDMKTVVHMLQSALNLPEHQLLRQIQLLRRLDTLKQELGPLEEVLDYRHTVGGACLSFSQGRINLCPAVPSRFVFAWDVMEPVTYFITYATSMGFLGYYILTKQELLYPDAKDRQFLHFFHKRAAMEHFDTHRYNALRDQLAMVRTNYQAIVRTQTDYQAIVRTHYQAMVGTQTHYQAIVRTQTHYQAIVRTQTHYQALHTDTLPGYSEDTDTHTRL